MNLKISVPVYAKGRQSFNEVDPQPNRAGRGFCMRGGFEGGSIASICDHIDSS